MEGIFTAAFAFLALIRRKWRMESEASQTNNTSVLGDATIAAVVFDMGGVVVSDSRWIKVLGRKIAQLETVQQARQKAWRTGRVVPNYSAEEFWSPILRAAGLPLTEIKSRDTCMREAFEVHFEVLGLIDRLKQHGYRVGIISNHMCRWFDHIWESHNLGTLWNEPNLVLCSSRARTHKPNPEIFDFFLKQSGLKAEECIFVDNKPTNTAAAQQVGFHTVLFNYMDKEGRLKDSVYQLELRLAERGVHLNKTSGYHKALSRDLIHLGSNKWS